MFYSLVGCNGGSNPQQMSAVTTTTSHDNSIDSLSCKTLLKFVANDCYVFVLYALMHITLLADNTVAGRMDDPPRPASPATPVQRFEQAAASSPASSLGQSDDSD